MIHPISSKLEDLEINNDTMKVDDICQMVSWCKNLEYLLMASNIDDCVLQALALHCTNLRGLKVAVTYDLTKGGKLVTDTGLRALAQGCRKLEILVVNANVAAITNASMGCIGESLKELVEFGLHLCCQTPQSPQTCLDDGIRSVVRGCEKLKKLNLKLFGRVRITNVGVGHILEHGANLTWLRLVGVGVDRAGFEKLHVDAEGRVDKKLHTKLCPKLQKLDIKGVNFNEVELRRVLGRLKSIKYCFAELMLENRSCYAQVRNGEVRTHVYNKQR